MSKYKVGDKVVMEITDRFKNAYGHEYYSLLNSIYSTDFIEEKTEPLTFYIEPLKAKICRQAAEITRLLADNKRLKAENGNGLWNIEQARAEGQNEAWELARKIVLMEKEGGMKDEDYKAIFGGCQPSDYILKTHTYPEAAAKVEAWEKAKEMSVESAIGNLTALKHDYENENNEDERHFNIALGMAIKALKQIGEE